MMLEQVDWHSFFAGLGSGLALSFALRIVWSKMTSSHGGNTVNQSKSRAGGDIVGRDKKE
jgi:hypothetical protein